MVFAGKEVRQPSPNIAYRRANDKMKYVDIEEGVIEDDSQFWEILYNENLAKGEFCFSERLIRETGG